MLITDDDDDDVSDDNASDDEDKETEAEVVFRDAREIMNRTSLKTGTATMEDRRFRSFFGARKEIVVMAWDMLGEGGLRPEKSEPKHLLRALYFLKVYPREAPGYSADGMGHAGGGRPAPREERAQASALGSLFFEGLSKGGPQILSCRWV